jgi:hypothetical protein
MNVRLLLPFLTCLLLIVAAFGRSSRSRVDGELMGLSVALEEYKADHGHYPTDPLTTEKLKTNSTFDPGLYIPASRYLYRELSGDSDGDPATKSEKDRKVYFPFRPDMLKFLGSRRNTYISDPWGNSWGYSTLKSRHPQSSEGNNDQAFDLWSTGGGQTKKDRHKWTVNW